MNGFAWAVGASDQGMPELEAAALDDKASSSPFARLAGSAGGCICLPMGHDRKTPSMSSLLHAFVVSVCDDIAIARIIFSD
jgi:hypothetical protein